MVIVMSSSFFLIFETAVLIIIAIVAVLVSKIMSEQQPVDKDEVYSLSYWVDVIICQLVFVMMNVVLFFIQNGITGNSKDRFVQNIGHISQVVIMSVCFIGVILIPIFKQAVRAENWLNEHEPADTGKHAEQSAKRKSNVGRTQRHQAIKPTPGLVVKSVTELLTLTNHDADKMQNQSKN